MSLLQSLYLDWFRGPLKGKYFEIRQIPHSTEGKVYREFHYAPRIVKQRPGYHLFFCVNPRVAPGDGKTISHAIALYADVDEDTEATRLRIHEFQPRVSAVIATGRGLHCYWFLQQPVSVEQANRVPVMLRGIASHLNADSRCTSLQQPLRMPGSVNPKNGRLCRQIFVDSQRRYMLEEFKQFDVTPATFMGVKQCDARRLPMTVPHGRQLPAKFIRDLVGGEKLKRLWTSQNLPEFVKNGEHNGSNRDFSIALILTWRGYKPEEIASVLLAAPYHKKFTRTESYLRYTINRAFHAVQAARVKQIRVA